MHRTRKVRKDARVTIGDLFRQLMPLSNNRQLLTWPPDAFALTGMVLQRSGAYKSVVADWPPRGFRGKKPHDWGKFIKDLGAQWHQSCVDSTSPPTQIRKWWEYILANRKVLTRVANKKKLTHALLQIFAAADEASAGIGIPPPSGKNPDKFQDLAAAVLADQFGRYARSSLCKSIEPTRLIVLPKMHTPQKGITIRSLSHHLALCPAGEVIPRWVYAPGYLRAPSPFNLLVVPWPTSVVPSDFRVADPECGGLMNLPHKYGFFAFDVRGGEAWPARRFEWLLRTAVRHVGSIHGVVLPELCLRSKDELGTVWRQIQAISPGSFLIAGMAEEGKTKPYLSNEVACVLPIPGGYGELFTQDKHHRWLLDRSQVHNYGLVNQLDGSRDWWECIEIKDRHLKFYSATADLTLCCLVCEDLARLEPISEMIRAVGPNLVVALLMDGPQLPSRWPARYATVLAEDPGCSVLTLTSLGMALLSRPPSGVAESRAIALWKDAKSNSVSQIDLPMDAEAAVLTLTSDCTEEFTADGRSDEGAACHWILKGVHPIRRIGKRSAKATST